MIGAEPTNVTSLLDLVPPRRTVLLMTLAWLALPGPARADGAGAPLAPRRTVVVLHAIPQEIPGLRELSLALSDGIVKGTSGPVDLYGEYTGLDRFSGPAYEAALSALYAQKYGARKVDLLVAVGPSSIEFVTAHRFLPGVPIVTCYIARRVVDTARALRPDLTGALPAQNAPRTIELMLSMFPATRRILVVLGASEHEQEQAERGREIFARFADRVELVYLNDQTLEEIEARVARAADDELVLFASLLQDADGHDFFANEALGRVSTASARPVFGVIYEDLGGGILGGSLVSMALSGKIAGELAARVLNGEAAGSIPLVADAGLAPMFDWRQLERWNIGERKLPAGSIIQYREPGLWESHGRAIALGLAIIAVESLLVALLVVQLRRRRRIEQELARSKARYRTVADFTHDWEFWRRVDGRFEYVSPACLGLSGHQASEFVGDPDLLERLVHEDDLPAWQAHQRAALEGLAPPPIEYRLRAAGGEVRWVRQASNPVRLEGEQPAGTRGSIGDITARKLGDLALQQAYQQIAALKDRLEAENTYYRGKIEAVEGSSELLGQSDPMKYLLYRIRQVAPSDTTVLIEGETGTGKELVAEAVHQLGPRKGHPLIKINCAALPPSLAESELFGHEKGAFTGAQAQRKGRFELADGGTLFLDEVGELSQELQAKLLRVLQDGTFQRVGGDRTLKADVRVIAATNRTLSREVAAGRFREDLWYRLNVFPITVPPLRQRKEDIPVLAQVFVERCCQRLGKPVLDLPHSVVQALQAHDWPGNVRELQNAIEQAVLISDGRALRLAEPSLAPGTTTADGGSRSGTLEEMERSHILQVLESAGWKLEGQDGAAALLGLKPSTLRSRMAKLGIQRKGS
jgi:PAS domain S-box-containing protein